MIKHIEDFGKQHIDQPLHSVNLFPSLEAFTIGTENDYCGKMFVRRYRSDER